MQFPELVRVELSKEVKSILGYVLVTVSLLLLRKNAVPGTCTSRTIKRSQKHTWLRIGHGLTFALKKENNKQKQKNKTRKTVLINIL